MSYRGCSKFHKIKKLQTATSLNYSITITKEAANKFEGEVFYEALTADGIILLKSGCDMFEKHKSIAEGLGI